MPISLLVTLLAVFATVALVSGSVASLALARNSPERRRLRNLTSAARGGAAGQRPDR